MQQSVKDLRPFEESIRNFNGINVGLPSLMIPKEELVEALNVYKDRFTGVLRSRGGLVKLTPSVVGSFGPIHGLHYYIHDSSNKFYIAANSVNRKLYRVDPFTWEVTEIGTLSGTHKPTFVSSEALFEGKLIIASGGQLQSYDNSVLSIITGVSNHDFYTGDGGIDDITISGTYTGTEELKYVVEIDSEGSPDTFKWSDDGGDTWKATSVAITGSDQDLSNGIKIKFTHTTGHVKGDRWEFYGTPAPKAKWIGLVTARIVAAGQDTKSYLTISGVNDCTAWCVWDPENWADRFDVCNVSGFAIMRQGVVVFGREPEELVLIDPSTCSVKPFLKGLSTVSHHSIVALADTIFFIDNDGIKRLGDEKTGHIGSKVASYIDGYDGTAFAILYPEQLQIWFIPSTSQHYVYVYHILFDCWTRFKFYDSSGQVLKVHCGTYNADRKELILGASDGHLYRYDPNAHQDDGYDFPTEIVTKSFEYSATRETKFKNFEFLYHGLSPGTMNFHRIDEDGRETLVKSWSFGTGLDRVIAKRDAKIIDRSMKIRLTTSSGAYKLYGIAFEGAVLGARKE